MYLFNYMDFGTKIINLSFQYFEIYNFWIKYRYLINIKDNSK